MSISFQRSVRSHEADSPRRTLLVLVLVAGFLLLWVTWFVAARVTVYAATGTARLEVDREHHPIGSPVSGRVIATQLRVGRRVEAGDILIELDAAAEHLAVEEEEVRLAPAAAQIVSLRTELAAQRRAIDQERRSAEAGLAEAAAKIRQTATAAVQAIEEAGRLEKLRAAGLVSELDALRAARLAEERSSESESAEFGSRRLSREFEAREQDRLVQVARLEREVSALEGVRAEATARSARLRHDIDQRAVRAPIGGTLAEVAPLSVGNVVTAGDRIGTIVPDGGVKVVAFFPPSVALGRVAVGQPAHVRLEAFPWTQYGSATARVLRVAGEPHEGQILVELSLDADQTAPLPMQHGLPAQVNVEIEQISPAALVLRTIAGHTRLAAMRP